MTTAILHEMGKHHVQSYSSMQSPDSSYASDYNYCVFLT